jgi:hypothetical protein
VSYTPGPVPQSLPAVLEYLSRELRRIATAIGARPSLSVRSVAVATTVQTTDSVITVDATAGAVTVTLPPIATSAGRIIFVKKTDASVNAVTIDGYLSETIDGTTTKFTITQYAGWQLVAGSTEWHLL